MEFALRIEMLSYFGMMWCVESLGVVTSPQGT